MEIDDADFSAVIVPDFVLEDLRRYIVHLKTIPIGWDRSELPYLGMSPEQWVGGGADRFFLELVKQAASEMLAEWHEKRALAEWRKHQQGGE